MSQDPDTDPESGLLIDRISKSYGDFLALDRTALHVRRGEFLTILGPSGSGKTTMLKTVAGFTFPDMGRIVLEGRDITRLRPAKRNIGMVFQNYALFPHMTVQENVGFPLRMRKVARRETAERVEGALRLVGLEGYGDRFPAQLSGGQQQRVALARAIVFNPPLLLLDEPFGALDRKLREQMQLEVKRLQRRLGLTALFVTHDQEEALILSDRIAVMNGGVIQQIDDAEALYRRPSNRFVADFIGESNLFPARVVASSNGRICARTEQGHSLVLPKGENREVGDRIHVVIRPEGLRIIGDGEASGNLFEGRIEEAVFLGDSYKYSIAIDGGMSLIARCPLAREGLGLASGQHVRLAIAPEEIHTVE